MHRCNKLQLVASLLRKHLKNTAITIAPRKMKTPGGAKLSLNGQLLICSGFSCLLFCIACKFLVTSTLFFPSVRPSLPPSPSPSSHPHRLPSYESSWEKNPCITKQLDQKPPVMQQGSVATYLLPRWEMEGERSVWMGGARQRQEEDDSHNKHETLPLLP